MIASMFWIGSVVAIAGEEEEEEESELDMVI
jgi:hypothetical protein